MKEIIEKIVNRLKSIFDEVTHTEDAEGLTITVKNKKKTKKFFYKKGTYEMPFSKYDDAAVRVQAGGMIADCVDEFSREA